MKKRYLALALALTMSLGLANTAMAASAAEIPIVEDKYRAVGDFSEGLAAVKELFDWGFIDHTGKEVISCQYGGAKEFSEGLAAVYSDGKWGFIDKAGNVVISFRYDDVQNFSEGLALVSSGGKYGFIDKTGREVVPCKYGNAESFSNGRALVYNSAEAYYGYVDQAGNEIIPCQYSDARSFSDGFALVRVGNAWTVIDLMGNKMLPEQYQVLTMGNWEKNPLVNGAVLVWDNQTNTQYLFNVAGLVIPIDGYQIMEGFSDGLIRVASDVGIYWAQGFMDSMGNIVIPFQYGDAQPFSEGFARVTTLDGKEGFIDKAGNFVSVEGKSITSDFSEGCAAVCSSASGRARYGFIDTAGREVVPCNYANVKGFSGGVAAVMNFDGKWGLVDQTGNEIVPCQYDAVGHRDDTTNVSEGCVPVMMGDMSMRWGVLSISGGTIN